MQHKTQASTIGASTKLLDNPKDIVTAVDILSRDFSTIEIELENDARQILKYRFGKYNTMVNQLNVMKYSHEVRYQVHAPYLGKMLSLASTSPHVRKKAVGILIKTINFAADIGAKLVSFQPGPVDYQHTDTEQLYENFKLSLQEIANYARTVNVTLCLKNISDQKGEDYVLNDLQHLQLCREFDIRLSLDIIYHHALMLSGTHYFSRIIKLLPFVANVYVGDMKFPSQAHLPLGLGDFPFQKVLGFIYNNGYQYNSIITGNDEQYPYLEHLQQACRFKQSLTEISNQKTALVA